MCAVLVGVVVAVIAVILLAGALSSLVRRWRRHQRDELRSIGSYHDRLDSLHVGAADRGGSVRLVAGDESPPARPAPGRPRVTPWSVPLGRAPVPAPTEVARRRGRRWALGRSEPRHRLDTQALVIVVVTAIMVGVLAIVGMILQDHHAPTPLPTRHHTAASIGGVPGYVTAPSSSSTNA